MQVQETLSEGLRREFRVVVPAKELDEKVGTRLDELKNRVQIRGFRPGKVPLTHLKRVYGKSVMAETIDATVQEANAQIVSDNGFRVATQPKITLPSDQEEVNALLAGNADLTYTVALEILPKFEVADVRGLKLEKMVAPVEDQEVDDALQNLTKQNRPFSPKEGGTAEAGDRVIVSFTGTIDGEPFQGGSADDITVELGTNSFIPGFEDQLAGIKEGEQRAVTVTFPKNYLNTELAGKEAKFDVIAKGVQAPGELTMDDEFAKSLGMESLDKLKDAVKERLGRDHAVVTRQRLKRALLDELDERHKFDLPPTLLDEEFQNVWTTVTNDLESKNRTFADEETTEEQAREEYRKLAERRVRLGLVLAEIGEKNQIKVTDEEVNRAAVDRARQFPGQEQQVWDHYRKNPQALASLRAPIFEEKVIDFLLELAQVSERQVTRDELFKDDDEEAPAGAAAAG
ncbi:MAG: trigger factor [Variibacter sp.]|jgi:trigger factor|nr:trigger factor [Variibacter sp.]